MPVFYDFLVQKYLFDIDTALCLQIFVAADISAYAD